jgi:hypothetical protein
VNRKAEAAAWYAAHRAALRARHTKAALSPWRVLLAQLLVKRMASLTARDLRRMSDRDFERLASFFRWFVYDECQSNALWVERPLDELRVFWDRRRRHAKQVPWQQLSDAYDRILAEGARRYLAEDRRLYAPLRRRERLQRYGSATPQRRVVGRKRPIVRPRMGRAPRRVVRVARRQRLSPSRSSDDDPEPARALGPTLERTAA